MTNRIENIIIALVTAVIVIFATIVIVQATAIKPLQKQIEKQNEVIVQLAKIEKYKYEISNEFGKMKPKDSQIILDLDNKLEGLVITPEDTSDVSTTIIEEKKKKGFLKRLFSKD